MRHKLICLTCTLVMSLGLAGCSLLPGSSQSASSSQQTSASVATQVAAAVSATVSARAPGGAAARTDTATSGPSPATATATTKASVTPTARPNATTTPTPSPTPALPAPVHLAEREIGGGKLLPRYWTNTSAIVFTLQAPPGTTLGLRPQVELEPLGKAFTGFPTAEGQALPPSQAGAVTVQIGSLPEGPYHWQARLTEGQNRGPWADFYNGPAFRLDRTAPSAVVISSTAFPDQRQTYNRVIGRFTWTAARDNGAVQGYLSGIDRKPNGLPSGPLSAVRSADLGPLRNGNLYFHVRAEDWAGNLGPVTTYAVHIDSKAPQLQHAFFDQFQFNPQYDKLTMRFTPNKDVKVQVVVRKQATNGNVRVLDLGTAPAGKPFHVTWDGRNYRGVLVSPGQYTMLVKVTDKLGNVGDGFYTNLGVNYRRIIVHLAKQSMDVYDGGALLRTTLVTTGNNLLPTPPGVWHIRAKFHPYKFISPWKKSSPYYYAPSNVEYALYFRSGGYFIHDAPWRTVYGPGTNNAPGPPGIYSGTHGCVNVPGDVMAWLYPWAKLGTVLVVEQ
jgi:hypothetical protein